MNNVSVLFSEPKIPQCTCCDTPRPAPQSFQCSSASRKFLNLLLNDPNVLELEFVSVLFSEPKIPQFWIKSKFAAQLQGFSALQRAENSSITP